MQKVMQWFRWIGIAGLILAVGLAGYALSTALRTEHPVGSNSFERPALKTFD